MTYDELVKGLTAVFGYTPQIGEDEDGQLVVYTNLREVPDQDELENMDEVSDA